jgi:hypothetical protein
MSAIEDAINRYGGGDEAYKQKLKEGIRDTMGYSNWMSKLGKETSAPAAMPPMKGNITPQGVLAGQETGYGIQRGNINSLERITGGIDAAAGSIASTLAAKNKADDKYRYDSSFIYQPKDDLDQRILDYARNPRNEDGSIKSVQQLESELRAEYSQGQFSTSPDNYVAAGGTPPKYTADDITNRLAERLPADYIGKEDMYSYRFNGMNEKQATEEQLINYSNMLANGQGDQIPSELYPLAYHLLSDAEKAKLRGLKGGRQL